MFYDLWSGSYNYTWFPIKRLMALLLVGVPNAILSCVSILLSTRFTKKFFTVVFNYPGLVLLPVASYFCIGPKKVAFCTQNEHSIGQNLLGFNKALTMVNMVLTTIAYGTTITVTLFPIQLDVFGVSLTSNTILALFFCGPIYCIGILFTVIFLALDTNFCCKKSQKCYCLYCCGPHCFRFRYEYININHGNNEM